MFTPGTLHHLCVPCVFRSEVVLKIYWIGDAAVPPREILQGGTRLLLGPRGQAETSLKIEDLRSNKITGKLS
jgi:hypothetical protein